MECTESCCVGVFGRRGQQDDDESYDSYEDDDDSYDSYDDEQDSSEEDDDDGGDPASGPRERAPRTADEGDRGKTSSKTNNPFSGSKASEEKKAFYDKLSIKQKREEQRRRWAEDREKRGLPPIREPDEPRG